MERIHDPVIFQHTLDGIDLKSCGCDVVAVQVGRCYALTSEGFHLLSQYVSLGC